MKQWEEVRVTHLANTYLLLEILNKIITSNTGYDTNTHTHTHVRAGAHTHTHTDFSFMGHQHVTL